MRFGAAECDSDGEGCGAGGALRDGRGSGDEVPKGRGIPCAGLGRGFGLEKPRGQGGAEGLRGVWALRDEGGSRRPGEGCGS